MSMTSRMLKCLRRIEARKSVGDLDAWARLQDEGFIVCKGPSDDIETTITPKGREALGATLGGRADG